MSALRGRKTGAYVEAKGRYQGTTREVLEQATVLSCGEMMTEDGVGNYGTTKATSEVDKCLRGGGPEPQTKEMPCTIEDGEAYKEM